MDQGEEGMEDSALIFHVCSRSETGGPELIFQVCFERGWIMYQEGLFAEGGWHMMWRGTGFNQQQYSLLKHWQMVNHIPGADSICRKHHLARHLRRMRKIYGNIYNFSPQTYVLPADYLAVLHDCSRQQKICRNVMWICKPVAASQGRGITIHQDLSVLKHDCPVVIQRYVSSPLLICGYKFDLRLYVCVTSYQPLCVYAYEDGLTRFATEKYDVKNLGNRFSHLTNTSVNKFGPSYHHDKERIGSGCKWSVRQLRNYFQQCRLNDWLLWQRISAIISLTVLSQLHQIPVVQQCFELYGFDVLIDRDMKPWLLEVNACPSLAADSTIDMAVKKAMLHDLFELVGLPRRRLNPLREDVLANVVYRTPGETRDTKSYQLRSGTSHNGRNSFARSMTRSPLSCEIQIRGEGNVEGSSSPRKEVSSDMILTEKPSDITYEHVLSKNNDNESATANHEHPRKSLSLLERSCTIRSSSFDNSSTSEVDSSSDEETSCILEAPDGESLCSDIESDFNGTLKHDSRSIDVRSGKNHKKNNDCVHIPLDNFKRSVSPLLSEPNREVRSSYKLSSSKTKTEDKTVYIHSNRFDKKRRQNRINKKVISCEIKQFLPTIKCGETVDREQRTISSSCQEGDLSPLLKNKFRSQPSSSAKPISSNLNISENSRSSKRRSVNQREGFLPQRQWKSPPRSVGGWTLLFPVLSQPNADTNGEPKLSPRHSRTHTNATNVRAAVTQIGRRLQMAKSISQDDSHNSPGQSNTKRSDSYF